MASPRFQIGIDLGTTNCALAYVDSRDSSRATRVLEIPQLTHDGLLTQRKTLPSAAYLPLSSELENATLKTDFWPVPPQPVIGALALERASVTPGRVVMSAKSWLCHGGVDREAKLLPWGSAELPAGEKLSAVEASAKYLAYLKAYWDDAMAGTDPQSRFDQQDITLTVPASFDEAAQRLTLQAARDAGFPASVRLLEEPQAAFYSWLESHSVGLTETLENLSPQSREAATTILICDIGGGTSDFSLFQIAPLRNAKDVPAINRIAVSEHLLLGGDNLDLALARFLETRAKDDGKTLSARQFLSLVHLCRGLKERVLSETETPESSETYHLSLPSEGSKLFAAPLSLAITHQEIETQITEGFFPIVEKGARPRETRAGFREWGLPFASDGAVTRHLAGFLEGTPIDAVLFTGGTLKPYFLQKRLFEQLTRWNEGRPIALLSNADMDLAVARGAAHYGRLRSPAPADAPELSRIRGGYPYSLFLELVKAPDQDTPPLVCVVAKGMEAGETQLLDNIPLKLLVDKPARFQLYSSRKGAIKVGEIISLTERVLHPLPPLQTKLSAPPGAKISYDGFIDVKLEVSIAETGLFNINCVYTGKEEPIRWQLDFNLRQSEENPSVSDDDEASLGVSEVRLKNALDRIELFYGSKKVGDLKDSPKNLKRELEKILGLSMDDWNSKLLRSLWPALAPGVTRKVRSSAHEITWLQLAGFCLRPGYGADLDAYRISELWRAFSVGISFPKEVNAVLQWWILWRRVAGGLDSAQQKIVFDRILPQIRAKAAVMPEILLLAGSLERVDTDAKANLGDLLVRNLVDRKVATKDQYLWTLGRLANRSPLYAGAQAALPPERVSVWIDRLLDARTEDKFAKSLTLFLSQAARQTGDRSRDLQPELREKVLTKMRELGASAEQRKFVESVVELDGTAQARLFGESVPLGIKLAG